jgi:putative ABC transport system permease protein
MLVGDRAKYIGIVMGLTFASFLITQQASIFVGLMTRAYGFISDIPLVDIWVMDPQVKFIDATKSIQSQQLHRVRSIPGVAWAMPLMKSFMEARLSNGIVEIVNVIGIDDVTLIGGPPAMREGLVRDLWQADTVIADALGAERDLAQHLPDGRTIPLGVGDFLEIQNRRVRVVGISEAARTFQWQPMIYTTYSRATQFVPEDRRPLDYILVKVRPTENVDAVARRITRVTGLLAHTRRAFELSTVSYFMKNTGIPINFGISILLGFLVGTAIAGQTFYNFTLDNLRHFGLLKAMGTGTGTLLRMILLQAMVVGGIGYGLGVGLATLFGRAVQGSELAFRMPWPLLAISAGAVMLICALSALISIIKVIRLDAGIVFKG